MTSRWIVSALVAGLCAAAGAQDSLTLTQALRLARERNGSIRSAAYTARAANSEARATYADFLPNLSPTFTYAPSTNRLYTSAGRGRSGTSGHDFQVAASWRVLDNGSRAFQYSSSRHLARADEYNARQTLRNTLFTVHQQYYDALRAQELLAVQQTQQKRADEILEATKIRVQLEDLPKKDVLQAQADALNARASVLAAENSVSTTQAALKATIGWDSTEELPVLAAVNAPAEMPVLPPLAELTNQSLARRPDLQSNRERVETSRVNVKLAQLAATVNWSVNAEYIRSFARNVNDFSQLRFEATVPLYDGGRSRADIDTRKFNLLASEESLLQTERLARAEIEAAYKVVVQDRERLAASKAALDAAQLNYDAAQESFRLRSSSILDVLTAQVTLVTAQSNYVEALYDLLIAETELDLVTGVPIEGEEQG